MAQAITQDDELVVANPDHAVMLAHPDPRLAANKRLIYDFWREVFWDPAVKR